MISFQNRQRDEIELNNARRLQFSKSSQDISERQNRTPQGSDQQSLLICVRAIRVNSSDQLVAGDHVVFLRLPYDHHGIITGKVNGCQFEITEVTSSVSESMAASIFGRKAKLTRSLKRFDFTTDYVSKVLYTHRLSHEETVSRAIKIYNVSNEYPDLYKYNVRTNNCEHFATYCATGKMYSLQAEEFVSNGLISYISSRLQSELRRNRDRSTKYTCIPCEIIV